MIKTIKINGREYSFSNTTWVCKVYKDIFKKGWHEANAGFLSAELQAIEFRKKIKGMSSREFDALDEYEKAEIIAGLKSNTLDISFYQETAYAMAVAANYKGTYQEFIDSIPPKEIVVGGKLHDLIQETIKDLNPHWFDESLRGGDTPQTDFVTACMFAMSNLNVAENARQWLLENLTIKEFLDLLKYDAELKKTGSIEKPKSIKTLKDMKELSKRLNN